MHPRCCPDTTPLPEHTSRCCRPPDLSCLHTAVQTQLCPAPQPLTHAAAQKWHHHSGCWPHGSSRGEAPTVWIQPGVHGE